MTDFAQAQLETADGRVRRGVSRPILDAGGIATLLILIVAFIAPALFWVEFAPAPNLPTRRPTELLMLEGTAILALLLPMVQILAQIR